MQMESEVKTINITPSKDGFKAMLPRLLESVTAHTETIYEIDSFFTWLEDNHLKGMDDNFQDLVVEGLELIRTNRMESIEALKVSIKEIEDYVNG